MRIRIRQRPPSIFTVDLLTSSLLILHHRYYRKYRRDTREWPSVQWKDKDRILRDELLQKASNLSVKDIEAGARKLGLQMSFGGPIGSEPEDA